jgi:glycosyltransferase involved in cell wall biosynthesis
MVCAFPSAAGASLGILQNRNRMKISVITPNLNGMPFLEATVRSVERQAADGLDLEYIVVDGGSTDGSLDCLARYDSVVSRVIDLPASGPAAAINAGFAAATGDVVAWLNSDDVYMDGALSRVAAEFAARPDLAMLFGHCPIIDEDDGEIRNFITWFKELFFPISSRATFQTINYISQPATFFSCRAIEEAGAIREDMKAAFDYEFLLRIWRTGPVHWLRNPALASFRWHEQSISAAHFETQFREELEVARQDAGSLSLQYLLHILVRWGIVGCYKVMAHLRQRRGPRCT